MYMPPCLVSKKSKVSKTAETTTLLPSCFGGWWVIFLRPPTAPAKLMPSRTTCIKHSTM